MLDSYTPPLVCAQKISKFFGKIQAVHDMNMEIFSGQCVALLGPNGAGKTTFVEILEGLQAPTSGEVLILGKRYSNEATAIYSRIGVVLQETRLYRKFTIRETLQLFASLYGTITARQEQFARVDRLIGDLHLTEHANLRLEKLSGGQRQRVYLGCALIHDPLVLFLDEPTTGLDPQARHYIWDIVRNLKKKGVAILLTTHDMNEAQALADDIYVMDHGRAIAHGTADHLINEICSDFPVIVETKRPTLEDVFLKLTGRSLRDG